MGEDDAAEGELGAEVHEGGILTMWTIYWSPLDTPGVYVVRAYDIVPGIIEPVPRERCDLAVTLELARMHVPAGLYRLERSGGDDRSVVETWI